MPSSATSLWWGGFASEIEPVFLSAGMPPGRRQTSDRVLHIAAALVQTRSFNAFSYADIARTVGIRKASLHQHCAPKAALGVALVARYRSAFLDISCNDTLPRCPRTALR